MPYVPLENLVKDPNISYYKLVLTAAARANELTQGATPLVKSESKKAAVVALEEISQGKVRYEEKKYKPRKQQEYKSEA